MTITHWPCRLRILDGKIIGLDHDLSRLTPKQAEEVKLWLTIHRRETDTFTDAWHRQIDAQAFPDKAAALSPHAHRIGCFLTAGEVAKLRKIGNGSASKGLLKLTAKLPRTGGSMPAALYRKASKPAAATVNVALSATLATRERLREYGGNDHGAITRAIRALLKGQK